MIYFFHTNYQILKLILIKLKNLIYLYTKSIIEKSIISFEINFFFLVKQIRNYPTAVYYLWCHFLKNILIKV